MNRASIIAETIRKFDGIELKGELSETEVKSLVAEIGVEVDDTKHLFKMEIYGSYPFQFHDHETIRFVNKEFLDFDHVNSDGSICIHTNNYPDSLEEKLVLDLNGLISWVKRYVIDKGKDDHYEHIIVPYSSHDDKIRHFLFTDVAGKFEKGQHGLCGYKLLANSEVGDSVGETYILREFGPPASAKCDWSEFYNNSDDNIGFFIFSDPPVSQNNARFAAGKWVELKQIIPPNFFQQMWLEFKGNKKIRNSRFIPVFFGYSITENKVHWQAATFPKGDPPYYTVKDKKGNWSGEVRDLEIKWSETFDCSYDVFFGRGKLTEHLVSKRIMLIGCGAVGSVISESLVRGGARHVALVDYDIKEPGNISRSNYKFINGVTDKTHELGLHLMTISPFVEVTYSKRLTDNIKLFKFGDPKSREILIELLSEYDFIIDCSTDNDLLFILDDLKPSSQVLSIGITNHAKELVFTTGDNLYRKTGQIFGQLRQDMDDLFNPTGCWSPTFKARHTDISLLVNAALNEVDYRLSSNHALRNFYVSREANNIEICHY
ncbi:ThiF family adenylyltransferase [Imperialibacter roseus]|uniref:ThiF family adenylyltransferase n=1 Tax=Imperialibacter roseus TaxID=1324217 RepID=A0ABZ0IZL9_9BACT|nr:ThiF family adenylyltransferase [Imperialibacter roseus]WOK09141.1 ThiF family adenylyltransferase [Imperialibacter roseus]